MFVLCCVVFVFNGDVSAKFLRDMILVLMFVLMGGLCSEDQLVRGFKIVTLATLMILLMELFYTRIYIMIFEPARYYANTRGIDPIYGSYGLYVGVQNADRFSFGIFNVPRASSIFLEQVSLANFSMVLAIFLTTFWDKIGKIDRLLYVATIVLIVTANNTRTGTVLNILIMFGYWIFPKLPGRMNVAIMPAILIVSAALFYDPRIGAGEYSDDINGRIGLTVSLLLNADFYTLFTGNIGDLLENTPDSGYFYIICYSTVFGLVAYWLYVSLFVPPVDARSKRYIYSTSLFIFINLMIGAAVFTIKVSAPLWMIGGVLCREAYLKRQQGNTDARKRIAAAL